MLIPGQFIIGAVFTKDLPPQTGFFSWPVVGAGGNVVIIGRNGQKGYDRASIKRKQHRLKVSVYERGTRRRRGPCDPRVDTNEHRERHAASDDLS